jgi:Domain of unknown function (DUF2019)
MTPTSISDMSAEQLVDHFRTIALEQDRALQSDQIAKYNRLFGDMDVVVKELKRRPGDKRRELVRLLKDVNAQVRLKSAIATLGLAPDAARQALRMIDDLDEYPQAPFARDILSGLDDGTYKPS